MWFVGEDEARLQGRHEESLPEMRSAYPDSELYWARRKRGEIQRPKVYGFSKTALSPCGRYFSTAMNGEAIRIWSVKSGECLPLQVAVRYLRSFSEGEVVVLMFGTESDTLVYTLRDGRTFSWRFLESKNPDEIGAFEPDQFSCFAGVGSINTTDTVVWIGQAGLQYSGKFGTRQLMSPRFGGLCVMINATLGIGVFYQNNDDRHERLIVRGTTDSADLTTWDTGVPDADARYSNLSDSGAFVLAGGHRLEYYSIQLMEYQRFMTRRH